MIDDQVFRLIAPDVKRLLGCYERIMNPEQPSAALMEALDPLIRAMADLAPFPKSNESKGIWITVPRGEITDWGDFEEAKADGDVESYEEFESLWRLYYPLETEWYFVCVTENKPESQWKFRSLSVTDHERYHLMINAELNDGVRAETWYQEEPAIELCKLILPAVEQSMEMLREGRYNQFVADNLPYQYRTGVIRRSVVYAYEPDYQERVLDGLTPEEVARYRELITSGVNDVLKIGRLERLTANDFFRACELGYKACGYETGDLSPSELYLRYADGRDEGLTGTGHGLNEGPGIDFDDPEAWEHWYFNRNRCGGHPWEVVRGGNSTHVDLFVCHDRYTLDWKVTIGELTQEEADRLPHGYFFHIAGKHRPMESVRFYLAIHDAGLPVIISTAEEILARYEGTDYIGIVPHSETPKYCESMFPAKYGRVIDFTHVYKDEDEWFGQIEWIPEEEARLIK